MLFDRPALVWFRRDLRDYDHAPLAAALAGHARVHCAFLFDTDILAPLPRADRRVEFLHGSVAELRAALASKGGGLHVLHGRAVDEVPRLAAALGVSAVYAGEDYEPAARARDEAVAGALAQAGARLVLLKDQVVFGPGEVLTRSGGPFAVFTPYRSAWLKRLSDADLAPREAAPAARLAPAPGGDMPSLEALGFERTNLVALGVRPGMRGGRALLEDFLGRIDQYAARRDYPAVKGPSYLSVHLRFGTVSVRELVRAARARRSDGAAAWLSELVWREFYFSVLAHRPDVVDGPFRRACARLRYDERDDLFAAWAQARTGYPLVDAAQRQILDTGYMHNRLRMVSASFLVKHLGIDWRRGERWFAERLIDYDLAANNGGWQWAASTGCDAQPWFRIFHPVIQSRKFDAEGRFIRRYLPALAQVPAPLLHEPWRMSALDQAAAGCIVGRDYPAPVVDHATARARTLARYAVLKAAAPD